MKEDDKSKNQLIRELYQRIAKLEKSEMERKRVEGALEESRKHFQTLFSSMVDPVVIVDSKGKFLEITDRIEEITGFKKEELLGKSFFKTKIMTTKSKAILIKNLSKRMMGMKIAPYEIEVLTKDRRKLPYEVNAAKIKYLGKPADMVVFRDITERKRTEKALKESEELYRSLSEFNKGLLESSPAGIMNIDREMKVEYENPEMKRILGLPLGKEWETIGMNIKEIPLIEEAGLSSIFDDLRKKKTISEETSFTLPNGEKGHLVWKGVPLFKKSQFAGAVLIVNDITKRKKTAEALKESEERYRTLVEHAYDWIWTLDKDGNFTYFNEAAERGSGYRFKEWKNRSFALIIVPEDLPHAQEIFAKTLKGKSQTYSVRVYNKDKEIIILEVNTVPIMKEGKIVGTVSVGRDITDRKRLEEQREKARKEAEFYADVLAHDIGNLDQITMGYLYLLQTAKDEETKKKNVGGIKKSIMKSARLTDNIKTLKKIKETKLKKVNLNKSIEQSIEKIKAYFDREIKVNLDIDKHYYVNANDFLDRVFFNVLENSAEFTFQEPVIIDIKIEEKEGFCNVHIRDRGIGIPKEKKQDILENLETLSKRTGMGLYLSKKILGEFNGKFEIKDMEEGTEIIISIPVME